MPPPPTHADGTPAEPLAAWLGGKRLLARRLIARLAVLPHRCYAEPFVGMGGVFLRRPTRAPVEVINDRHGEVVNLFRVVREHPDALAHAFDHVVASRAEFARLHTTYPSREEAAGAAAQALADAETADAELELRLPFTPDAHVLHPVVLEAVPAALRAVLAALPPRWTLHQVRHQLGSRAAATTTLTCRPAPAQTPAVIDHPPLAATPLPLGPGPLTLPGPAVPHPPHRLAIVQQVAAETGYPRSGLSATAFTQRVAERLHAEDARWGRRVNSTGPISDDTVAYQIGDSPHNPFSVDIILGAGGPTPRLHWVPHGRIGGTWIAP